VRADEGIASTKDNIGLLNSLVKTARVFAEDLVLLFWKTYGRGEAVCNISGTDDGHMHHYLISIHSTCSNHSSPDDGETTFSFKRKTVYCRYCVVRFYLPIDRAGILAKISDLYIND
jgi:hypothetical protein